MCDATTLLSHSRSLALLLSRLLLVAHDDHAPLPSVLTTGVDPLTLHALTYPHTHSVSHMAQRHGCTRRMLNVTVVGATVETSVRRRKRREAPVIRRINLLARESERAER